MEPTHCAKLTSAEVSQLWANYQNDTMVICILKHFLKTVEDPNIATIIEEIIDYPISHLPKLTSFFNGEGWATPKGFTESDFNQEAPKLYSDSFMLHYLYHLSVSAINFFGTALGLSTREDVREYFSTGIVQAVKVNQMTNRLLLEKGLCIRSPYLTPSKGVHFAAERKFLGNWLGENRPLTSMEITNLFANIQRNVLGKTLLLGFSQVAGTQEIRNFMVRGKRIAEKNIEVFSLKLKKDDLPDSTPSGLNVTDSVISPFSDKLMMFHATALISISIEFYAMGIGTSLRKDITTDYVRVTAEIAKFASDGVKILIDNNWLEEPPQAPDRDHLAKEGGSSYKG